MIRNVEYSLFLNGLTKHLASNLARNLKNHSYCYDLFAIRSTCFASFSLKSIPLVKYAGSYE